MKDVADKVGVSRQLVSIVMRDLEGASSETRERIRQAAKELGYRPDASARLLRQRRSHQLGVVYTMHQPFEVDLVEKLFAAAEARGYTLVLGTLTPDRPVRRAVAGLLQQRIEAIIILAADGGEAVVAEVDVHGLPIVQLSGPRWQGSADDVRVDNAHGIDLVVDHLVSLGHEQIVHVDGGEGPNAAERREAYIQAMARHRLDSDIVASAYTEEAGAAAARSLLGRAILPSAIVCGNDRSAFGLIETLVRAGARIPEDVSVVGYDDSSVASLSFLELTTVRHDPDELARLAIDAVTARLKEPDRPVVTERVAAELVVRASTRAPSRD